MIKTQLHQGNCLELMDNINDKSIDMILCDLPYARTHNKWDVLIPFGKLWEQYLRVSKENAAIVLFADGMFMADLMQSQRKLWRYNLVWDKRMPTGFLNANRQPLRIHEEICVFYQKQPTYNPQKVLGEPNHGKGKQKEVKNNNYGEFGWVDAQTDGVKYPNSIISTGKAHPSKTVHPTQKPVKLLEYLIKTYTQENEIVLDNCMGSGSTGVACINTNRNFIGMELNEEYFNIAKERIDNARKDI